MNATSRLMRAALAILLGGTSLTACAPVPPPTPSSLPPFALLPVELTGVGAIRPGRTSLEGLTFELTEADVSSIARGEGSLAITFTDASGSPDTISLTGTPAIVAPGSLVVSATLPASNLLLVSIVDSDPLNIESIAISRLRLAAAEDAAPGPIRATISECAGSLAGCAPSRELVSPGTVTAP